MNTINGRTPEGIKAGLECVDCCVCPYSPQNNAGKALCKEVEIDALALVQQLERDAEVRHGRWIHPKDHVVTNEFFCSECNKRTVSLRPINRQPNGALLADENGNFYHPPTMKYCSECGARMDLED